MEDIFKYLIIKGLSNQILMVLLPPLDSVNGNNYTITSGQAYGPASYNTSHMQYSASGQSASNRMSNGNIFVNASGGQGGAEL